jgi:hypothetical protein
MTDRPTDEEPIDDAVVEAVIAGDAENAAEFARVAELMASARAEVTSTAPPVDDEAIAAFIRERDAVLESDDKRKRARRRRKAGGLGVVITLGAIGGYGGLAAAARGQATSAAPQASHALVIESSSAPTESPNDAVPMPAARPGIGESTTADVAAEPSNDGSAPGAIIVGPDRVPPGSTATSDANTDATPIADPSDTPTENPTAAAAGKKCGQPDHSPDCPPTAGPKPKE